MCKTVLITSFTDRLGPEVARELVAAGHHVLLQGRSPEHLDAAVRTLSAASGGGRIERYAADLSSLGEVVSLADAIAEDHGSLDVLVNGASVHCAHPEVTEDGLDIRFAVNTIAPWVLTRRLLPCMKASGRVINLSAAVQAPVDPEALVGEVRLADGAAYAQSKLALAMWSRALSRSLGETGPAIILVNPGSALVRNLLDDTAGASDEDLRAGAGVLVRAALGDDPAGASGRCFDDDEGGFATPHPDALDVDKSREIVHLMEGLVRSKGPVPRRPRRARTEPAHTS